MLQKTTNGNLLKLTNGNLVKECCCGFTPTLICAGGASPSMVLTVEGASGTIGWCGQTWNLPGDSGVQKEVCPTSYAAPYTGTFGPNFGKESWVHNAGANDGLLLKARVVFSGTSTFEQYRGVAWADQGVGNLNVSVASPNSPYADWHYWLGGSFNYLNLGVLSAASTMPTIGNYRISNGQFGSYVFGGVTYTWSKGTNW